MGLDFIEVVLEVEEKFGIAIEDDEITPLATLGQFSDLIARKFSSEKPSGCPTAKAFYLLRRSMTSVLSLPRKDVRPTSSTTALLPYWGRNRAWKRLEQSLALRLPPLANQADRTILWSCGISMPTTFLLGLVVWHDLFAAVGAAIVSLLPAVLFGFIVGILFLPHTPYRNHQTIGGLAKGLIAYNYDRFVSVSNKTSKYDEVWENFCDILVEQIGLKKENLRREVFLKDLSY
jgi:hypothetical protein